MCTLRDLVDNSDLLLSVKEYSRKISRERKSGDGTPEGRTRAKTSAISPQTKNVFFLLRIMTCQASAPVMAKV